MVDYLVMLVISVAPWLFMRNNLTTSRAQGLLLLACYGGYVMCLVIRG